MKDVLFIDLETQSGIDISNVLSYVSHPSTQILCAVAKRNCTKDSQEQQNYTWIPGLDRIPSGGAFAALLKEYPYGLHVGEQCPFPTDIPWVAHNAMGFDALIWDRLYPNHKPDVWYDTIPMCRAAGLPGGLDKVSQILFGEGKKDAKLLIKTMCNAKWNGNKWTYPVGTPALWKQLIEYNIHDVLLLEKVYNETSRTFTGYELLGADFRINSRGFNFDKTFAMLLLDLWNCVQKDAFDHVAAITNGELKLTDLRSPVKVKKWLETKGCYIDSLNKQNITEELEEYEETNCPNLPLIVEVIREREKVTRGSKGKIERLLEIALNTPDTRLRHSLVSNGAHTGRYSGRGLQPHNLAKAFSKPLLNEILKRYKTNQTLTLNDLNICECPETDAVEKSHTSKCVKNPADRLTELMRPVFCAPSGKLLTIGDYAQIEARILAWISGESLLLRAFADPAKDVYCEMSSKLFGRRITKENFAERQLGKIVVLGCGYGMGKVKFEVFCKKSKPQIRLTELGLTAEDVITAYRKSVPAITIFWKLIEQRVINAVHGNASDYGRLWVDMDGKNLHIILPSGRPLVYRNARIESRIPKFCAMFGMTPFYKPTIIYDHPHGREGQLYGGLITENICQAIGNDFLRAAILQCDREKLDVVMHVHDSIVLEDERDLTSELEHVMMNVPSWAAGFPMKVDIHCGERNL